MIPTPEQINGFELAMAYMTLAVDDKMDEAAEVLAEVFNSGLMTAVAYTAAISNFAVVLVKTCPLAQLTTPQQAWAAAAQKLQEARPPEWQA